MNPLVKRAPLGRCEQVCVKLKQRVSGLVFTQCRKLGLMFLLCLMRRFAEDIDGFQVRMESGS